VQASCATGGLRVLTDASGDGVGMTADGVVMKLLQNRFLDARPIAVDGNSPQPLVPGTPFVERGTTPTGSPTYPLDVLAAFSGDRKTFFISVVNPTEQSQSFSPQLNGVRLRGAGTLHQVAPPSLEATNAPGQPPAVTIVETPLNAMPETVQVPPVSVSIYAFEVA
jgi:alpha-N-arabinofuranosidase